LETTGVRPVEPLNLQVSVEWLDSAYIRGYITLKQGGPGNDPPSIPRTPDGQVTTLSGLRCYYSSADTDPETQPLFYQWDFSGDTTGWIGPYDSGTTVEIFHQWMRAGQKSVRVRAQDVIGVESPWSELLNVTVILCGDVDASDAVDIDDVVFLIQYIFASGTAPDPIEKGDVDVSGAIDIDDVVFLIQYIFSSGPSPCS
jgi:hypothetical protein